MTKRRRTDVSYGFKLDQRDDSSIANRNIIADHSMNIGCALDRMPRDILLKIFELLTCTGICSLRTTCRYLSVIEMGIVPKLGETRVLAYDAFIMAIRLDQPALAKWFMPCGDIHVANSYSTTSMQHRFWPAFKMAMKAYQGDSTIIDALWDTPVFYLQNSYTPRSLINPATFCTFGFFVVSCLSQNGPTPAKTFWEIEVTTAMTLSSRSVEIIAWFKTKGISINDKVHTVLVDFVPDADGGGVIPPLRLIYDDFRSTSCSAAHHTPESLEKQIQLLADRARENQQKGED